MDMTVRSFYVLIHGRKSAPQFSLVLKNSMNISSLKDENKKAITQEHLFLLPK